MRLARRPPPLLDPTLPVRWLREVRTSLGGSPPAASARACMPRRVHRELVHGSRPRSPPSACFAPHLAPAHRTACRAECASRAAVREDRLGLPVSPRFLRSRQTCHCPHIDSRKRHSNEWSAITTLSTAHSVVQQTHVLMCYCYRLLCIIDVSRKVNHTKSHDTTRKITCHIA